MLPGRPNWVLTIDNKRTILNNRIFGRNIEKINVTEQARVAKDQVGNGVKETTNHNSRALVQTIEKELSKCQIW